MRDTEMLLLHIVHVCLHSRNRICQICPIAIYHNSLQIHLTLAVSVTATKYQFLIAGLEIMDSVWIVPFHDCHKLFPDHYKM